MNVNKTNPRDLEQFTDTRLEAGDEAPPPTKEPVIYLPSGQGKDNDLTAADLENLDQPAPDSSVTAGDPDALEYQAEVVGEESIGGTTPTPEQNDVDDIAAAVGIDTQPDRPVAVKDEMDRRDRQRFELDPDSKDPVSY